MTEKNEYNNKDITMEKQNGYDSISMKLQDNSDYEDNKTNDELWTEFTDFSSYVEYKKN